MKIKFIAALLDIESLRRSYTLLSSFIFLGSILCPAQEVFRADYNFYYKRAPEEKHRFVPDMTLDFDGERSLFYSEFSFEKDSVRLLAFDRRGQIKNQQEYGNITSMPAGFSNWSIFQNHRNSTITIWFSIIGLFIKGTGIVEPPVWELLEEEKEIKGYSCRKGRTSYSGRMWTVWFTDQIPVSCGPWLLRGLPGLIISAEDADNYFRFELRGVRFAPESRYAQRLAFYEDYSHRPGRHHFEYPLHEAYPIFNRAWSSSPYFDELTGMHTATGKYTDKMGNWIPVSPEIPHIPLIPDDYWKSSRQVFR